MVKNEILKITITTGAVQYGEGDYGLDLNRVNVRVRVRVNRGHPTTIITLTGSNS